METKQMTLRSQTVRCPHCGEYYSVTYKYCPFCDAGRQEEERRHAEKKKQRQSMLGGIFGGIFTATEAAAVACIYGLLVSCFVYRELKLQKLKRMVIEY